MEDKSLEKNTEEEESTDEMKAMIDRYHNLLIEQEKRYSVMFGERVRSVSFLRKYIGKFYYALIIEACIRLLIITALWLVIFTVIGFSGRSFMWMFVSLILYAGLEVLDIVSRIKLAREAIYQ
jgi:TM2 domain-containing membrane protein YozV